MNTELIVKIESLKNMLVARATGGSCDPVDFLKLRGELIVNAKVAPKLPRFVHTCRNPSEFWGFIKPKFAQYHERREFIRQEFDPLLTMLEQEAGSPSDGAISATIQAVNSTYIQDAWKKAIERRTTDPEGAITAARTLLETVCKHILDMTCTPYDDSCELTKLYSSTAKQLNLSPSQHTEQLFRQILGGCQAVVEGLGALRNRHSDAHGKGISGTRPAPRHAELAVNLAGTMATFILQTWEVRNKP